MPISPYGHNDMGSEAEWAAYHARIRREKGIKIPTIKESFEKWWKRQEASGLPLSDPFEVAVVKAHSEAAYRAGIRRAKR
jgi:hypothetical protein